MNMANTMMLMEKRLLDPEIKLKNQLEKIISTLNKSPNLENLSRLRTPDSGISLMKMVDGTMSTGTTITLKESMSRKEDSAKKNPLKLKKLKKMIARVKRILTLPDIKRKAATIEVTAKRNRIVVEVTITEENKTTRAELKATLPQVEKNITEKRTTTKQAERNIIEEMIIITLAETKTLVEEKTIEKKVEEENPSFRKSVLRMSSWPSS